MSIADQEIDLTAEEREIVDSVHRFAAEVMRPDRARARHHDPRGGDR